MRMDSRTILFVTAGLIAIIAITCILSEMSWGNKFSNSDSLRATVGLPSLAVGNLNPVARNPGLELFCTGLLDVPGGYCYYFTDGVTFVNSTRTFNITVSDAP